MKKPADSSCPITPVPDYIGPYRILKKIASGGMGEVFLAKDPFCDRSLALKKIRSDKIDQIGFKERFLKEVKIAAKLSHPSIIPIYQIHYTDDQIYYTMPLVEGSTLKEILRKTKHQEKNGLTPHPIGSSTSSLMRIFLNICQAIAYCHAKGVLHRDLKPENIIIGLYGEVLILDWGLADFSNAEEISFPSDSGLEEGDTNTSLTRPGKIAGTLCYLPPERIFGKKASFSSDIYALGVILYQMLTLRFPFYRTSVKHYKKQIKHEKLIEPSERAPYRDIPSQLAKIAKKCLASRPEKRYKHVEEILLDLNNYIEGRADWVPCAGLQIESASDWKFQENILLAKHISLAKKTDVMEWVHLMIAKDSFSEKVKLQTHVRIKEGGWGIGFLLTLKPIEETKDFFQDSFFVWIGSESHPGCYLFRSHVELLSNPNAFLKKQVSHFVQLEKTNNHIRLFINNTLVLDYLSHTPFNSPCFGVVLKDNDLDVGTILVSKSSPNIQVNCFAVPDTLLSLQHFKEAQRRYREIANSFSGRIEGKEALFRTGIALLEEAKCRVKKKEKEALLEEALKEFDLLSQDTGSPLEYLGKSLVYKQTRDLKEELKCLELSLRKFVGHPLLHLVKEQVLFRLHESFYKDRTASYELALLLLQQIPEALAKQDNPKLLEHLNKTCEPLPFLQEDGDDRTLLSLQMAFWLNKPLALFALFEETSSPVQKSNALYCLLYLQQQDLVKKLLASYEDPFLQDMQAKEHFSKNTAFSFTGERAMTYLLSSFYTLTKKKQEEMTTWLCALPQKDVFLQQKQVEFLLYQKDVKKAEEKLKSLYKSHEGIESQALQFLQDCLDLAKKTSSSPKIFQQTEEENFPRTHNLIYRHLNTSLKEQKDWEKKAFFFEKIALLEQLALFYSCAKNSRKQKAVLSALKTELSKV